MAVGGEKPRARSPAAHEGGEDGASSAASSAATTRAASNTDVLAEVAHLQNVDTIREHLQRLRDKERQDDGVLRELLTHGSEVEERMASLQRLTPKLSALYNEAWDLSEMVGSTCALAENVSSKVKELDLAKGRVQACIKRVDDVIDLKACVDGVQVALAAQDFEKAAWHVHRYLVFDKEILEQEHVIDQTGQSVSPAAALDAAQAALSQTINDRFDSAVEADNEQQVLRFFKLFPLLDLHRTGLRKYGRYLAAKVAAKADGMLTKAFRETGSGVRRGHVNLLNRLFEDIAKTIEQQEPMVETPYGPGNMITLVQLLQHECDTQASRIIRQFLDDRNFDHKVDVVQMKLLPGATDERGLDARDLDPLLTEIAQLLFGTALFFRFIRKRIKSDIDILSAAEKAARDAGQDTPASAPAVDPNAFENMMRESDLNHKTQLLAGHYISFEEYFLKINVEKALDLDSREPEALTSTVVDDAFFLMKKCARRAITSASVDCVCAMLNHMSGILTRELRNHFMPHIREFPASGIDIAGVLQGRLTSLPAVSSSHEDERRDQFIVTLNNLQTSHEYTKKLVKDLSAECSRAFASASPTDQNKLQSVTSDLESCGDTYQSMLQSGLERLCAQAVDPRVQPLADLMNSTSYCLTEDDLASFDMNSPFMTSFISGIQSLLTEFKGAFVGNVQDAFVAILTEAAAAELERVLQRNKFNRLGGIQFDRDMRGLVAFLSAATSWTVRDKFARLTQIATILNLEQVGEIAEYWGVNSGPLTWRLTPMEVRKVLALRLDFAASDIANIKL